MSVINTATTLSADELVCIVDENNNVVGESRRDIMRRDALFHRATFIFAKNSIGQFYVQKRSMLKDYCPGFFDPVSGGVVASGESYEDNARREIEEEMGIRDAPMTHLFTFLFQDADCNVWGDAWEVVFDGELTLQEEEVESVHPMTMEEILADSSSGAKKFTPDGLHACRLYVEHKASSKD